MTAEPVVESARSTADVASTTVLIAKLRSIVGNKHVLIARDDIRPYRTGFRTGEGPCIAVIRPGSLVEMWRAIEACVAADVAIVVQAANTGLTGGSTPTEGCDRDVVVLNTLRIKGVHVIEGGKQVICFPGATLHELEAALKPYGREPHSVIGSSCIGASVIGGICNNSGGALVRRGPAYTELSAFARLGPDGRLEFVNHLGADLSGTPEEALARLEAPGRDLERRVRPSRARASDTDYERHVRDVDACTPARFNADPRRLFGAAGSAGKLAVFAVRLDTFPAEPETATFYLGTNDPEDLTELRRKMLQAPSSLPIAAEYIHREAFDMAARYGKDTFLAIRLLGVERLPLLYKLKNAVDALARKVPGLPDALSDRLLQALSRLAPSHLPSRMLEFRDSFEHHLLLKVGADAINEARELLQTYFAPRRGAFFECTAEEAEKAFLHRFVTAGAAVRYRAVHPREIEDIVALDVALRRNERDWVEMLPADLDANIVHKLYYGHFFCHVFHQDYLVRKGVDVLAIEHRMWRLLDERGAEYPAEHNVGQLYPAKPTLAGHYQTLDPLNVFNPGVGLLSKRRGWA